VPRVEKGQGMNLASNFITPYRRIQPLSKDEMEALPTLIEARVAWRVFRKVRRIVKAQDKKKRLRGARRFRMYVAHLRRVRMIQSSWKSIFAGACGQ
jgi:Ser/Thr protein kinase RdoA (MazF antagonist)